MTGPETFTYEEFVYLIKDKINSKARIFHLPPWLLFTVSRIVGEFVNDIVITKDEVEGLMGNLLCSKEPVRSKTPFSCWLEDNSKFLGIEYASELKRHYLRYS